MAARDMTVEDAISHICDVVEYVAPKNVVTSPDDMAACLGFVIQPPTLWSDVVI